MQTKPLTTFRVCIRVIPEGGYAEWHWESIEGTSRARACGDLIATYARGRFRVLEIVDGK